MQPQDRGERFARTVEDSKHAMYRVAWLMVRNDAEAQDAVSDAIEAAWQRLDRIRDLQALPAYLIRCTINACHATLRRRKRELPIDDPAVHAPAQQPGTPVWMYLSGLPDKYRLPLLLRYAERMAVEDIARALRLPRGTVSSRLARGLNKLREDMIKEEQGRG